MNLKPAFIFASILFSTLTAFSAETCYEVSSVKDAWSKTPEVLCVSESEDGSAVLSLKTGMLFQQKTVAIFNLQLLERAKCIDCNEDVYGLDNPSNSSFNALSIVFKGKRDIFNNMVETGTVSIGSTVFYYQSL